MGTARIAQQQAITLGKVAAACRLGGDLDHATVAVLAVSGADALADNGAGAVLAQMDHLGARVRLLPVVGQSHTVELAHRVVALQDATGVFPRDGAASLDLSPRQLAVVATA